MTLLEITNALTPLIVIVVAGLQKFANDRLSRQNNEVKDTVKIAAKLTVEKLGAINSEMNGTMAGQKKAFAAMARRVADLTGADADKQIAEIAENASRQHVEQQAAIDRKKIAENTERELEEALNAKPPVK